MLSAARWRGVRSPLSFTAQARVGFLQQAHLKARRNGRVDRIFDCTRVANGLAGFYQTRFSALVHLLFAMPLWKPARTSRAISTLHQMKESSSLTVRSELLNSELVSNSSVSRFPIEITMVIPYPIWRVTVRYLDQATGATSNCWGQSGGCHLENQSGEVSL